MLSRTMRELAPKALSILVILAVSGCVGQKATYHSTMNHHTRKISVAADPAGLKSVILLRKGSRNYGVLIPLAFQGDDFETISYRWYYRTDGKGTFKRSDAARYKSGTGVVKYEGEFPWYTGRFGPFELGWSGRGNKSGWIYYPRLDERKASSDKVRICITEEKNLEKINATDRKWVYKGSVDDLGIRANGKKVTMNKKDTSRDRQDWWARRTPSLDRALKSPSIVLPIRRHMDASHGRD